MKKMNCLIVDDEELARELVENYINRLPHLTVVGKCANPFEAIRILQEQPVDLLFLDIQMPELTGVEFLKTLSKAPAIIFTTAYDQYALAGYELSVIDYLLKPFSFTRFLQAVNKATEIIDLRHNAQEEGPSPVTADSSPPLEFLLINADRKVHRVYLKDIVYIQSMKEYVVYFTDQGKLMAWGSLKSLEEKLPIIDFMRVHKSYIVAKNRVNSLNGNQLELGEITIPIGGSYRQEVLTKLFEAPEG